MRLSDSVHVNRDVETVRRFFMDPQNLPKWDRSVAEVVLTSRGPIGVGSTFDTIGPAPPGKQGLRTSYRAVRLDEWRMDAVVTKSNFFRTAVWETELEPTERGTIVHCAVEFALKPQYVFLAPLLLINKRAIGRDLSHLKEAIDHL